MTHKEHHDLLIKIGATVTPSKVVVMTLVNKLIDNLYLPVESDLQFIADREKIELHGMDGEPINWGDLKCCEVLFCGNRFYATIDEASPNDCPNLCAYIEKFMHAWGWEVEVRTEW